MSEIILDMWLYTHHTSALLAKKSDNINKVSPILLPLQTLHIKSTIKRKHIFIICLPETIKFKYCQEHVCRNCKFFVQFKYRFN